MEKKIVLTFSSPNNEDNSPEASFKEEGRFASRFFFFSWIYYEITGFSSKVEKSQ